MRKIALFVLWLAFLCGPFGTLPSAACIWDRDTLAMERARFPGVNELIVGYFPRHSQAYYQWRLEQVLSTPVDRRTPADYDDLAASYDKLGQHRRAIETMLDKIERYPDRGRYESQANLGTFYIHDGELSKGLTHIEQAIAINPDAHFGREVYQKLLVQYMLETGGPANVERLTNLEAHPGTEPSGFIAFVLDQQNIADDRAARDFEIDRAIEGVLGMMRFGHYDSPVLLEVLGELLLFGGETDNQQRLASRAFLKASYEVDDPLAQAAFRKLAEYALVTQEGMSIELIEQRLKQELAQGETYFAQIEKEEQRWAEAGKDLDAEFAKRYYDAPVLTNASDEKPRLSPTQSAIRSLLIGVGVVVAVIAGLCVLLFAFKKRRLVGTEPAV
jgi:tetratricopeptide (TPR) repeat protein